MSSQCLPLYFFVDFSYLLVFCLFLYNMTRPKFRPCTSCQTPNQANKKTCSSCYQSLSTKKKLKEKVGSLDSKWGQAVMKNRNTARIIDSACIAVRKLEAIGCMPVLFLGRKAKASNTWEADVITYLEPSPTTRQVLERMQRAYEYILSVGTSVPVQPRASTEQQFSPDTVADEQPDTVADEQPDIVADEQPETVAEEKPKTVSDKLEDETVFVLELVAVSPPVVPSSPSLQRKKRQRRPSPKSSTSAPPPVSATADHAIAQSLSQGGLLEEKKRKGCRKCSRQKIFKFEAITGRRINEDKPEVKVQWLPCPHCGKSWDDTWEPEINFSHHFTMPGMPPPPASMDALQ